MAEPAFAALVVEAPVAAPCRKSRPARKPSGRIELVAAGITVRVAADIDDARLTRVIRAIRAASE